MKKLIYGSLLMIMSTTLFFGCKKKDFKNPNQTEYVLHNQQKQFDLKDEITVNGNTSYISKQFFKMGGKCINVANNGNYTLYTFKTTKGFYLNGSPVIMKVVASGKNSPPSSK